MIYSVINRAQDLFVNTLSGALFCNLYTDVQRVSAGLQSGLVQNRVGGLTQILPAVFLVQETQRAAEQESVEKEDKCRKEKKNKDVMAM